LPQFVNPPKVDGAKVPSAANWRIGFDERIGSTAAALGAVERLLDSRLRYFTAINNLTSIQSLRLPVHVVVANVPTQLHTENMHECLQLSRLAATIGMQALT
jgi:hypothetical protein